MDFVVNYIMAFLCETHVWSNRDNVIVEGSKILTAKFTLNGVDTYENQHKQCFRYNKQCYCCSDNDLLCYSYHKKLPPKQQGSLFKVSAVFRYFSENTLVTEVSYCF